MANRLNMAKIQAIEQLQALKWSQRKIARELGIDRGAVARHLRRLENDSKAASARRVGERGRDAFGWPVISNRTS
ncbi:MAG: winged helix-turn-helix domain-containing protein [Pirellulales bacterium]|nr:winged helix-turn-helix domain-containing protein [Pirellulales bacterium]